MDEWFLDTGAYAAADPSSRGMHSLPAAVKCKAPEHHRIAVQVSEYLDRGGTIREIPLGVTKFDPLRPRR